MNEREFFSDTHQIQEHDSKNGITIVTRFSEPMPGREAAWEHSTENDDKWKR